MQLRPLPPNETQEPLMDPNEWLDGFEKWISKLAKKHPVELPLEHTFTPGLYSRKIFMPKGSIGTSRIHKTEHQFAILKGRVSVWTPNDGITHYAAPYLGITRPGTRRLLFMHEDTEWVTFHVTDKTDPEEIIKEITYVRPSTEKLLLGNKVDLLT